MELAHLIKALSSPAAYTDSVAYVEVRQTHISVVFLAGEHAYKIKKPVNLGFLDFTTLEKRRHFCMEEVRLNRRVAASVYLGVVPITHGGSSICVEGAGEPLEWAVKMVRLPDRATFLERLQSREIGEEQIRILAKRIASFHASAEAGPRIAGFGRLEVVARNARENFEQAVLQIGVTVSRPVFDRLRSLTDEALTRLAPLIEQRAELGIPRDTHGDMRLDHVYLFPEAPPPSDIVIIDCIEFNERFRFADPVADMAFVAMDLSFHGRRDLAGLFGDEYFRASGDTDGRQLLPFYSSYRAAVRAKVEGFKLAEPEIPDAERSATLARSQAHWLLAFAELEQPGRRPCLVLIAGLPGTGKSTLARHLAERAGFHVVRSDEVRKELAGQAGVSSSGGGFGEGPYTPQWTERTYAECLRRAGDLLFQGERVIVDANFRKERQRQAFLEMGQRMGVSPVFLLCRANEETVRHRLRNRLGDMSDANWGVYQHLSAQWEKVESQTERLTKEIHMDGGEEEDLAGVVDVLEALGLA